MKTLFFGVLFTFLFVAGANAQKGTMGKIDASEVPASVKTAHEKAHAGSVVSHWEKHQGKEKIRYTVIFGKDSKSCRARYSEDGTPLSYTVHFKPDELPSNMKEAAKGANPNMEIRRGDKITIYKTQKTFYRITLKKDKDTKSVYECDENGKSISVERKAKKDKATDDED